MADDWHPRRFSDKIALQKQRAEEHQQRIDRIKAEIDEQVHQIEHSRRYPAPPQRTAQSLPSDQQQLLQALAMLNVQSLPPQYAATPQQLRDQHVAARRGNSVPLLQLGSAPNLLDHLAESCSAPDMAPMPTPVPLQTPAAYSAPPSALRSHSATLQPHDGPLRRQSAPAGSPEALRGDPYSLGAVDEDERRRLARQDEVLLQLRQQGLLPWPAHTQRTRTAPTPPLPARFQHVLARRSSTSPRNQRAGYHVDKRAGETLSRRRSLEQLPYGVRGDQRAPLWETLQQQLVEDDEAAAPMALDWELDAPAQQRSALAHDTFAFPTNRYYPAARRSSQLGAVRAPSLEVLPTRASGLRTSSDYGAADGSVDVAALQELLGQLNLPSELLQLIGVDGSC